MRGAHSVRIEQERQLGLQAVALRGGERRGAVPRRRAVADTTAACLLQGLRAATELGCIGGAGQGVGHKHLQAAGGAGGHGCIHGKHQGPPSGRCGRSCCRCCVCCRGAFGLLRVGRPAAADVAPRRVLRCGGSLLQQLALTPQQRAQQLRLAGACRKLESRQAGVRADSQVGGCRQQRLTQLAVAGNDCRHQRRVAVPALAPGVGAGTQQLACAAGVPATRRQQQGRVT